jgi:signal transduction histidine kinase
VYNESEKGHEYWNLIEECCNRLDYNITSTLQYYKNSRYSTVKEEVNFEKLIQDLIVIHKLANNVDDKITFEVQIDQAEKFLGDAFRIEIILGNLISNAIKYQKPDEENKLIKIDVKVNLLDAVITIVDNGLGILNDHLNKIFNQFFRVHNQKGTGLGLFIVREALAKLDGKISVESVVNSGTKFTLRIPNEL